MSKATVEVLESGFKLCVTGEDGMDMYGGSYYGLVSYENLQNLEGKILTMIDASFQDREQRKAVKDMFRRMYWFDWIENNMYKGTNPFPIQTGMPDIENLSK